jgi:hypothetical protein
MAQETPRLEASSEELLNMVQNFGSDFYEIHLLLKTYETQLDGILKEVILKDSTEESSGSDHNMLH